MQLGLIHDKAELIFANEQRLLMPANNIYIFTKHYCSKAGLLTGAPLQVSQEFAQCRTINGCQSRHQRQHTIPVGLKTFIQELCGIETPAAQAAKGLAPDPARLNH